MEAAARYSEQYYKCKDIAAILYNKVHRSMIEPGRFFIGDADEIVELVNCLLEEEDELRERYVDLMIARDNEYLTIARKNEHDQV